MEFEEIKKSLSNDTLMYFVSLFSSWDETHSAYITVLTVNSDDGC